MRKNKNGKRRIRRAHDWLQDIRPSTVRMTSGALSDTDFDQLVTNLVQAALEHLHEHGWIPVRLLGVDTRWRPVVFVEGPEGMQPRWGRVEGRTVVAVGGPIMDNLHIVRQVFDLLGVEAAVLAAESWSGDASEEARSLPSSQHRAQAFGRSEAVFVDAYYPAADYQRFVVAPMVRMGTSVAASVVGDTGGPDSEYFTEGSLLEPCFPLRRGLLRT